MLDLNPEPQNPHVKPQALTSQPASLALLAPVYTPHKSLFTAASSATVSQSLHKLSKKHQMSTAEALHSLEKSFANSLLSAPTGRSIHWTGVRWVPAADWRRRPRER